MKTIHICMKLNKSNKMTSLGLYTTIGATNFTTKLIRNKVPFVIESTPNPSGQTLRIYTLYKKTDFKKLLKD